jgi:hypothetical protein
VAPDSAANADDDDEADDDASLGEEMRAVVEPVTPFIDGDVVSRKSGGSIGTLCQHILLRLEREFHSLTAFGWHCRGQYVPYGAAKGSIRQRNVVRDCKALAQYGRAVGRGRL